MLIGLTQQIGVCGDATVGKGLCSWPLRQQRRQMVRFIKMLGEFILSYRFSHRYAVPIAASPTDGASPFPTVGVCDKQQLIQLLTKADMQKMNLRCNTNSQAKFKMANSEAGKHKHARPDVNQGLACLCRMLAALRRSEIRCQGRRLSRPHWSGAPDRYP